MRFTLPLAAIAAVAACALDRSTGPVAPIEVDGLWLLNYSVTTTRRDGSCIGGGQVVFESNSAGFAGSSASFSRRCVSPSDTTMEWRSVTIADGQRLGSTVSFTDSRGCVYSGTVRGENGGRIDGEMACATPDPSAPVYSGSWTAMRPLPD
jgi:hypothetical protein